VFRVYNRGSSREMRTILLSLICILVVSPIALDIACPSESSAVLIVSDDEREGTLRTIKGIRQTLERSDFPLKIDYLIVSSAAEAREQLLTSIAKTNPSVLVTVGSKCTRLAKTTAPDIPVVFASVLNPVTSGLIESYDSPGNNITGASLDISIGMQIARFKQLVPNTTKLGVFYSERSEYVLNQALIEAADQYVEIVPFEIRSPRDVPIGVDSLTRSCSGILAIPDELIYTPPSTKHILLESFRSKLPVMGFSPSFVQSGALFALIVDHKFVGVQAGGLVIKVLHGIKPGMIPVTMPEAPYLYLNRNTAEKLRIDIPAEYYTVAKEVYE
jgi:putative ABC transport system substrate-binding protein